jgi:hypothetical protein
MKTTIRILLLIALLHIAYNRIRACTSFAVYSQETWYGMNFDYPETDIKFLIIQDGNRKLFRAEFGTGGYICGINESGLFTNYQLLYYNQGEPAFSGSNILSFGELNDHSLNNFSTVIEVTDYIGDRLLVPSWDLNLHTLFADKTGGAIVAEPFGLVNGITTVQNGFIVMTNFPNYEFIGEAYNSVYGVGSGRYIAAYGYIQDHFSGFGYENGFETLRRTVQSEGDYPTQISFLFDPVHMEIYFCLDRDFSRVWKVSFENGTLETYSGFSGHITHTIGASGIWASDLMADVTGIEEQSLQNSAAGMNMICPNPSAGIFTIGLNALSGRISEVEIFNSSGNLVFTKVFQNEPSARIELTGRPAGMYFVRVLSDTGVTAGYLTLE